LIKLSLEQLRNCTCKKHYEERCKILYDQGKVICWTAGLNFNEPKHCLVCMEEELVSLREANKDINEKRLFLLRAIDAAWAFIDALPPGDPTTRAYINYKTARDDFEERA